MSRRGLLILTTALAVIASLPRAIAQRLDLPAPPSRAMAVSPQGSWLLSMPRAVEEDYRAHLQFPGGIAQFYVGLAINGASRRIDDRQCQAVFADYKDGDGSTLWAKLDAAQKTPAQFLEQLWFVDASDGVACQSDTMMAAFTTPGSRVIYVCGSRFADRAYSLQGLNGEMIIIHELLHSLGLRENPPTSAQITSHVTTRCGGRCEKPRRAD